MQPVFLNNRFIYIPPAQYANIYFLPSVQTVIKLTRTRGIYYLSFFFFSWLNNFWYILSIGRSQPVQQDRLKKNLIAFSGVKFVQFIHPYMYSLSKRKTLKDTIKNQN